MARRDIKCRTTEARLVVIQSQVKADFFGSSKQLQQRMLKAHSVLKLCGGILRYPIGER